MSLNNCVIPGIVTILVLSSLVSLGVSSPTDALHPKAISHRAVTAAASEKYNNGNMRVKT